MDDVDDTLASCGAPTAFQGILLKDSIPVQRINRCWERGQVCIAIGFAECPAHFVLHVPTYFSQLHGKQRYDEHHVHVPKNRSGACSAPCDIGRAFEFRRLVRIPPFFGRSGSFAKFCTGLRGRMGGEGLAKPRRKRWNET